MVKNMVKNMVKKYGENIEIVEFRQISGQSGLVRLSPILLVLNPLFVHCALNQKILKELNLRG